MDGINKHWYAKWWGVLALVFLTVFLIFFTASLFYIIDAVKNGGVGNLADPAGQPVLDAARKVLIEGDGGNFWLGAANPEITIVEFADFSCSFCANSFPVIREIGQRYKDNVKVIFRDYTNVNEYPATLALAARCAGEQGLFWPMHDRLYINQGVKEAGELSALAKTTGADMARFNNCIANKKYLNAIEKDLADGKLLGVTGTPTWFINGYMIEGDIPYQTFVEILDQALSQD